MSELWRRRISRRDALRGGAVAAGLAAAACAAPGTASKPTPASSSKSGLGSSTQLKVLQWSHFIPAYDTWFDGFVKDWGAANGITATVDHINTYDLPARIATEVAAGSGHDLVEMNAQVLTYLYRKDLVNMDDINSYAQQKLGTPEPLVPKVAKVQGEWLGWVDFYIAILPIVNQALAQDAGMDATKLKTWNDYMKLGEAAKAKGHPAGIPISHCNDSNHNWRAIMYSMGASLAEADGKTLAINKPEFKTFLEFAQEFYTKANTPEVFAWIDSSDNQWLDSGQGVMIHDAISSMRSVEKTNPQLYSNLVLNPPEVGPAHPQGLTVVDPNCYVIYKFSQNKEAAKAFLKHYIDNYHEAFLQSQLYNMPSHANPWQHQLWTDSAYGGQWAEQKFAALQGVRGDKAVVFGYPGSPNYQANQALAEYVLPDAIATAVKTPGSAGIQAAMSFLHGKLAGIYT